jgi:hypothetical protein
MTLKALSTVVWTILAGGVCDLCRALGTPTGAPALGGRLFLWASPIRRVALALAKMFERVDSITARWPVAGICLLALAAVFGIALWAG